MTLGDFFEPRDVIQSEPTVHKTNWPGAHESIRPILDKFDELQGGTPRSVDCRKVRQAAARAWVAEFGENSTELLALAYSRAKHGSLTIATERSLIQIALPMKFKAQHKDAYICPECCAHPCQCEEET